MKAIVFPYTLDPFGETQATTTPSKIYLDRLLTLLSTQVGQRPMLPEYGTDLGRALFENEDNFRVAVKVAILTAVTTWLPELKIQNVDIDPLAEGYVNLRITVELPNAKITSVTVNSAIFGANGQIQNAGA